MGSGRLRDQYGERFNQGQPTWSGEKGGECLLGGVKQFGGHEVRELSTGGYELSKGGVVVGSFRSGRIDPDRVVFPLSHGTWLEVSDRGTREILSPEKAMLGGLIASDGGNHFYYRFDKRLGYRVSYYTTRFASEDIELMELFDGLSEAVYDKTPRHYGKEGMRKGYISSKEVFYDLNDLGVKTGPDEFHIPREHLDSTGKRAYLAGFFSGDGNISKSTNGFEIRVYSEHKEGLEEVRQTFLDLGFHPSEIHESIRQRESRVEIIHNFSIPVKEHRRFAAEIGSHRSSHIGRLKKMGELWVCNEPLGGIWV